MADIKTIQKQCLEGRISVLGAIDKIDSVIGGITSVDFKNGIKFKLYNHNEIYSLDIKGIRNNQLNRLYGMAVLSYSKAVENESIYPGQIHISKYASTKHHLGGIYSILNKYQNTEK